MKDFFSIKKLIAVIGIFILAAAGAAGAWWYIAANRPPSFGTTTAKRGNVVASIDEPGNVLTDDDVTLSFQESGQIATVNVNEGDAVPAGKVLASLDQSSLRAGLEQADAGLAAAQAKLDELVSGTRPEQLAIDQAAVTNAVAALGADDGTAYSAADDAIHNQTDNLFENPINEGNPIFFISMSDSQTQIDIENQRLVIGAVLDGWYAALSAPSSTPVSLSLVANSALQQIQSYLDAIARAVDGATPSSALTSTALAGYKADVVAARTEVGSAITALTAAESALETAQNQRALAEAGSTPQDIEVQKAVVQQLQAQVASAQVAVDHADLTAPFAGVVRNLSARVGQVVASGAPVLSLTNNSGLKIETYVSEGDVAKVKTGDAANVTLDAYGTGTVFGATVTTVDSAETVVNGTPAYKVTLYFTAPDSRIKDGMTGSVHIITAEHDNVVEIPSRLIVNDGDKNYVLVKNGGMVEKREVVTGLSGDDGMTEIISGVAAGDALINF